MSQNKLFMFLLGCKPKGRHIEQHDVFFTIGKDLKDLVPQIKDFWKGAGSIHIDAWRTITFVEDYEISVKEKRNKISSTTKLFFINLGGYKPGEFEEYHYRMIIPALDKSEAIKKSKSSAFYQHTGFKGAASHIDDKYGIDVDDIYAIEDILPIAIKSKYNIAVSKTIHQQKDQWHIGYTNLSKLK